MRYLFLLVALLLAVPSYAAEATSTLSWVAPETRVDGTPMASSEIAEFRVYYGVDITEPLSRSSTMQSVSADTAERVVTLDLTPRPDQEYVVSFAVTTVDTDGRESMLSDTVSKSFLITSTAFPGAPTQLDFTLNCGDACEVLEVSIE